MAKKATTPKAPKAKSNTVDAGLRDRLKEQKTVEPFKPSTTDRTVARYVKRRSKEMQEYRRGLNLESRWKQADEEYVPHELDFGTTRKRFETDQDSGMRSRMVPVGDSTQQWRQASSAPTLLSKIQTAVGVMIDNMPEADLVALIKKYEKSTDLAYALWKRNWSITDAKEKLKLVVFNLIKYGWAPQRTFPRLIKYPKRILTEKDTENPENDKYEEKEIEYFNDVDREPLNPFRTWIDEMSKPYDPYSTNEVYFEMDFSYDAFMVEFGHYPNAAFVPQDSAVDSTENEVANTNRQTVARSQSTTDQSKVRKDIVTVGFFESRTKDLNVLYIPKHNIPLYYCPMPNDDGYLSVTHTMWILRSANLPYGISLWEIIRQNKGLYDKMKNMTMDQLVLSIMKFGFFAGTSPVLGDGKIEIVPGQARQLTSSTGKPEINWMDIPGPGEEAWKGLGVIDQMMDDDTGISAMLEGADTPGQQTLGELLHRKESALKRLKVPVANIAWLIEQDAYVTLSWMSQIYSIPTIRTFADESELRGYEKENEIEHMSLFGEQQEDGSITGPFEAHYLPQLSLHLEDNDGQLTKSKSSKYFQVGKDIQPSQLKWKGIFKVIPRSIIDSSQELMKASKGEIFNVLAPLLQFPPQLYAKAAKQILKINEEDPADWLPDDWVAYLEDGTLPPPPPGTEAPPVGHDGEELPPGTEPLPPDPMMQGGGPTSAPAPAAQPQSMQAGQGTAPMAPQTVVPQAAVPGPGGPPLPGGKGVFGRRL